jgi:riboflavin kinase/FMN adenylyltransferase
MPPLVKTFLDDEVHDFFGQPLVMAIGTFDGVHLGHRKLIAEAIELAKALGGCAAVFTFAPHPTSVTHPRAPKSMIYDFDKKYRILEKYELACIVEQKFDAQFAKMSPQDFLEFLHRKFPTLRAICVGENFKFGHGRSGNIGTLSNCAERLNISVTVVPSLVICGELVSSSRIRKLLGMGNSTLANLMLGK